MKEIFVGVVIGFLFSISMRLFEIIDLLKVISEKVQ